jgi:DNA-binding LacI/PurR family transcriptional regulator
MSIGHTTIKDIARKLNISPSTVSRALRNHPDISLETKKKVSSLAEELDYHPNLIAKSLQKRKTNTIGIIVPEIRHDFFKHY